MPTANLDVFLTLAGGTRSAHFIGNVAARADDGRVTYAAGNFPGESRGRSGCRDVAFGVDGHARNRARWRMGDDALGVGDSLFVAVKQRAHVFLPFRRIDSGPPIEGSFCFPGEPDFPRMLGEQVHLLESLGHGEAARALTHDHEVIRVLHTSFGEARAFLTSA